VSVGSNFLCGRPHGAYPLSEFVMSLMKSPLNLWISVNRKEENFIESQSSKALQTIPQVNNR